MARKKTAAPKREEFPVEEESQDIEELEASEPEEDAEPEAPPARRGRPPASENGGVSKADAVRAALAEGKESPEEGVTFIRERFGIDMAKPHFSAVKSQQRKREGSTRERNKQPATAIPTPNSDIISDIEAIRRLLDSHGKDGLLRLIEALG